MNLADLSVRRGVTVAMVYLIIVGFGIFSLTRLQLDLYPDVSFPTVVVITSYTGASPEDIETLISRPIEGAVSAAKDAQEVRSTSKQGVSIVEVKFDWGKDMEVAETDVRRKLELIKNLLPDDADQPIVFAFDPSLQPVVMMVLSGPYPLDELRRIAERDVEPRLVRLDGIASAEIAGGLEREVHVVLDPLKLAAFDLDVNTVVGAVFRENAQVPGGSIEQGKLDFTIQTEGKYRTVAELGQVVVGMKSTAQGPVPVKLSEVARIEDSFHESTRVLEVDGVPAVWVLARKQSGANTVRAAQAVIEALPEIKRATNAEIDFGIIFNQADFINRSLGNLSSTGIVGVVITFFVLLLMLRNVRSSLIVASAIPISVVATFGVMNQAHMTLNIFSMAGLALGIGMLVDNAIVVLESIYRLREEGLDAHVAAVRGASTVGLAVTASTLTTIAVFVPVLFVPGIAGVLFKDMSITICFSLILSLLVAMTFVPFASSRLMGSRRGAQALAKAQAKDVLAPLRRVYARQLAFVLGHRWVVAVGLGAAVAVTVALAVALPTEFVAQDDQSMVFVSAETPIGNNLGESYRVMREAQKRIEEAVKPEERRLIALDVGVGKGFVALFAKGVHAGTIRVPLVAPEKRRRSQAQIEDAVRAALATVPGLKYTVAMPFNVMGGQGDIDIEIRGYDLGVSRQIGLELREQLRKMPEMAEVNFSMDDQKPEVRVRFDRAKMAEMGLSSAAVGSAISTYFMGKLAGRYSEGGDEFDIIVRYAKENRLDIDELRRMPIATPTGAVVPLANVADLSVGLGPVDVVRKDQERISRLTCYLRADYTDEHGKAMRKDLGGAISRVSELLRSYPWPRDFRWFVGGTAEDFITSFRYLGLALAVSVFLVYMVMASQFESLREPFIIMFTVPLALVGVVLTFVITRSTLNISALVGVIMLVGIVVNNGIIMVEAANQLRAEGLDRFEAIRQAAATRLRPILLTSLTTILAMVPLALGIGEGAAGWEGMAKAVIGGLTFSTALTLFVIPTMYTVFARRTPRRQSVA
jgi:HAE1 family hydrophobic/amphiphilic exporter-1